jgi:hypothetical protein
MRSRICEKEPAKSDSTTPRSKQQEAALKRRRRQDGERGKRCRTFVGGGGGGFDEPRSHWRRFWLGFCSFCSFGRRVPTAAFRGYGRRGRDCPELARIWPEFAKIWWGGGGGGKGGRREEALWDVGALGLGARVLFRRCGARALGWDSDRWMEASGQSGWDF